MKILFAITFLVSFFNFASAQNMKEMNMDTRDSAKNSQPATYTCVMHSQIHSAKPGNCPICGMKLVKEKPKTINVPKKKAKAEIMTMPMPAQDSTAKSATMDSTSSMNHSANEHNMDSMDMPKMTMRTIRNSTPPIAVRYDLYVKDTMVNFGGVSKRAIAVNGQIPMPTLSFTEGDTAEIYVHNEMDEETSLHWHGLFLPNRYDGVPFLTQMPIKAHSVYLYKFPIVQHGTHWYHSHTGLQEQIGMYGAFIMNKREELDIPTIPVVISEWANMKPEEIQRRLHTASDWFAIEKGTTQSYGEAIKTGHFSTKVTNEWKRMTAMDVSDVYYDKFLINGENQSKHPEYKAGDKVRFRIANGGASSYFWLTYAGGKITVIASDGNDVEPVEVDRLIIAASETYDVIVTIPENKSYEFLVTPEDRTKSASIWLGKGDTVAAARLPKLKYFAGMKMMNNMMDMEGNMIPMKGMEMSNQTMDMNSVMYPEITGLENKKDTAQADHMPEMKMDNKNMQMSSDQHTMPGMDMGSDDADITTLNYGMLRSTQNTVLRPGPLRTLNFTLTGNMTRYVWTLDNKTISEADRILIKKGENLRIIIYNNSMMRHPMHLHGHDFRVLNGQGDFAPLKNIIDIMPMERDTIEFAANEPGGDWFFHCHILYHMMSGMGRVFSYENSQPNPEIPDPTLARRKFNSDDRMAHLMAQVALESNGADGSVMLSNTRWKAQADFNIGLNELDGYESEAYVGRYLGRMQWWFPYVGYDFHYRTGKPTQKNAFGQVTNTNNRNALMAGIQYTLPMLIIADLRFDTQGNIRFQLSRQDISVTSRLRFNFMVNTDKEYMAGFRYIFTRYLSLSTHYDSNMGIGAGITFTY